MLAAAGTRHRRVGVPRLEGRIVEQFPGLQDRARCDAERLEGRHDLVLAVPTRPLRGPLRIGLDGDARPFVVTATGIDVLGGEVRIAAAPPGALDRARDG